MRVRNLEGVHFLMYSQLFLVSMDALGKFLSATYSPLTLVWARYCALFALILMLRGREALKLMLASRYVVTHIFRATMLLIASLLGLYALKYLPLAETAGLAFTTPFFVIVLAWLMLGERVGQLKWLCMVGGACGALLIARPGGAVSLMGGVLAISASIAFAFYQIMTRALAPKERGLVLLVYPAALGCIGLTFFLLIFEHAQIPVSVDAAPIALLGLLSGVGHYFSNKAIALSPISILAPFMYVQLMWATAIGWALFGELPDGLSFCGFFLIMAFGMISIIGNRVKLLE